MTPAEVLKKLVEEADDLLGAKWEVSNSPAHRQAARVKVLAAVVAGILSEHRPHGDVPRIAGGPLKDDCRICSYPWPCETAANAEEALITAEKIRRRWPSDDPRSEEGHRGGVRTDWSGGRDSRHSEARPARRRADHDEAKGRK